MMIDMDPVIKQSLKFLALSCLCLTAPSWGAVEPSKVINYSVSLPYNKLVSYGACRINDKYHVFFTAGYMAVSEGVENWHLENIYPEDNREVGGGPELIVCKGNPMVFSRDYGLHSLKDGNWVRLAESFSDVVSFRESQTSDIYVNRRSGELYRSTSSGWEAIGGNEFWSGRGAIFYYSEDTKLVTYLDKSGSLRLLLSEAGGPEYKEISTLNLRSGYLTAFKLKRQLYFIKIDNFGLKSQVEKAYIVSAGQGIREVPTSGLDGTSPDDCVELTQNLVSCRGGDDLIFFSASGGTLKSMSFKPNAYFPKWSGRPNVIFGESSFTIELGGYDGSGNMAGKIFDFSYSSVLDDMAIKNKKEKIKRTPINSTNKKDTHKVND
ncbi:hypothetical protein [Microbulbifer sp. YPW16]|uniref:hypothetical protein n=1 Tax=Microbulbifer sp. YPW16 TaxID=2904242 RepID=UPI001E37FBAD|nr:hypothetical protein [Microbulbifer sp. YPW16]UHQ56882.1 hypothetical protein LVE68_07875 [Microbulbifer sp. YPW16]